MKENITKSLTDSKEDYKKEEMTENIMKNITDCDEDHQNDFHDFLNRLGSSESGMLLVIFSDVSSFL
jgi:hypothetical protein